MKFLNGEIGANRMATQYIEAQKSVWAKTVILKEIVKWANVIKEDLKKSRIETVKSIYRVADKTIEQSKGINSCKKGCNFC